MTHSILVGGEAHYVGYPVKLWTETKLAFNGRPKRPETRAVWLHHTGGERPGPGLHDTLTQGKVSVNLAVDQLGVIWQYCDADVATAHAGGANVVLSANPWAVGIEFINRANTDGPHSAAKVKWPREVGRDRVHGVTFSATLLYPVQIDAGIALVETLCKAYELPMRVPTDADGNVRTDLLTLEELRDFRGVGGHMHNHRTKTDPGSEILREIARAGRDR